MSMYFSVYAPPLVLILFLGIYAFFLFKAQANVKTEDTDTKDHSERIYKDFEMYLKTQLPIIAAFGYIRLEIVPSENSELGRQALLAVGALELFIMFVLSMFVISHQGSKIRRWKEIEWGKFIFWQELWGVLSMWFLASAVWIAAHIW